MILWEYERLLKNHDWEYDKEEERQQHTARFREGLRTAQRIQAMRLILEMKDLGFKADELYAKYSPYPGLMEDR
jgi:hypothetical protein